MKYISFVVTSRNDGKTADDLVRMQIFIDSLIGQCNRFNLDAELILVEWNPPSERPLLAEVLRWPKQMGTCPVRIIQVPQAVHVNIKNSNSIPLFQMVAKNVGIRRAHGQFVLATNVDILFSDELMQFLASGQLNLDRMYRINRYDIPATVRANLTLPDLMEWCSKNVVRVYRYLEIVNTNNGIIPPTRISSYFPKISSWLRKLDAPLHTNACGDFTLLSMDYWMRIAGNPEIPVRAMKLDGLVCYAAHYAGAREIVLQDPMRIYHLEHPARGDGALAALANRSSDSSDLQISSNQYQAWVTQMRTLRRPIIFNEHRWGLANEVLPETVIA